MITTLITIYIVGLLIWIVWFGWDYKEAKYDGSVDQIRKNARMLLFSPIWVAGVLWVFIKLVVRLIKEAAGK